MPIKPENRQGKGSFQEPGPDQSKLESSFIDDTIKKASNRTTVFDFLYMIVVGFFNILSGLLGINDKKDNS